jgi:hypothetical protein
LQNTNISKIDINNRAYQKSFETLKTVLINEPILKYPDYDKPFILTTDASNYAIGAVLSQGKIGSDLPVGYASRTLNSSEQQYITTKANTITNVINILGITPNHPRFRQITTDSTHLPSLL